MQRIAVLEEEKQVYKKELENLSEQALPDTIRLSDAIYRYIPARVVFNQITETDNYILLNKGRNDGVKEDMGVVSVDGIVGVVMTVSAHFSQVLPVLNSRSHPSCVIKNTKFFGSLFWDGKNPRYIHLSQLPSHTLYSIGDTIVTSGYSATFPEGIPVGIIEESLNRKSEGNNSLKIRLFTDLSTLSEVFIIPNPLREEQINIAKGVSTK